MDSAGEAFLMGRTFSGDSSVERAPPLLNPVESPLSVAGVGKL